jgi:hypothetical protein
LYSSPIRGFGHDYNDITRDIHGEIRDSPPDPGADEFVSIDDDTLPDCWEIAKFEDLDEAPSGDLESPLGDGVLNYDEYRSGMNPLVSDTDEDSLADGVELVLGTNGTNPDTDGDTVQDGLEVAVGLDPLDPSDGVRWYSDEDSDMLTWQQEWGLGSNHLLQDTNWDGIIDGFVGLIDSSDRGGLLLSQDLSAVLFLHLDVDGDGLTNDVERILGSDPFRTDTDGDGTDDFADAYPADPTRHEIELASGDTTPPDITLFEPSNATPLP